jgi:hypothetical protein
MFQIPIRSASTPTRNGTCLPLPALCRDAPSMAGRFRRWSGASGRSYLVSVFPIDDCPDYVDAVIVAVDRDSARRVWVGDSGDAGPALRRVLAAAQRQGADEVHLHLLAQDAAARAAAVRDLAEGPGDRHCERPAGIAGPSRIGAAPEIHARRLDSQLD